MHASSFIAPLFFAATSLAQGVEVGIAPSAAAPEGCETTVDGNFTIGTLKIESHNSKRETAQEAADGVLLCTLDGGVLVDQYARIGSVVANHQFQFDGPPQAGAIYTGGFAICKNDSLAIGGTTRWWQCSSGPFYNLYDEWIGDQCEEIRIQVGFASQSATSSSTPAPSSATSSDFSGAVSTLSVTQSGLTTSHSGSATVTSGASTGSSSPTASSTGGSASSTGGSASSTGGSASASTSTSGAPAPPAQTGAATSPFIAKGTILGAIMAIVGAALSF